MAANNTDLVVEDDWDAETQTMGPCPLSQDSVGAQCGGCQRDEPIEKNEDSDKKKDEQVEKNEPIKKNEKNEPIDWRRIDACDHETESLFETDEEDLGRDRLAHAKHLVLQCAQTKFHAISSYNNAKFLYYKLEAEAARGEFRSKRMKTTSAGSSSFNVFTGTENKPTD